MDTEPTNPEAVSGFADGVAGRVTGSETAPWVVFGPRWAQDGRGADPPPDGLSEPVWAPETGWMEKADAPIHKSDGGTLTMYAPDSIGEVAPGE